MNPGRPRWRRAGAGDLDPVRDFLGPREGWTASLSGRLLDHATGFRPPRHAGGLFVRHAGGEGAELDSAVLFTPSGSVLPVFDPADGDRAGAAAGLAVSPRIRAYAPAACLGREDCVEALESALGWEPRLRIRYDAMSLEPGDAPGDAGGGPLLRRAAMADLEELLPLAEAYDQEEVVTCLHRFDPAACRLAQERSLARQSVWVALEAGRIVARAQTNARGWRRDQVGGVYVLPAMRGRGLGAAVVGALARESASRGRGLALFVKKSNPAAVALYRKLGFSALCDFRVDYFA